MGDIFDEIAGNVDASPVAAPVVSAQPDIFDEIADNVSAAPAPTNINSVSAQLGKGLTLGWFDEIQGVESGLQGLLANVVGRGNGRTYDENYQAKVDAMRAQDTAFAEENPISSYTLPIAGAAAPAVVGGIAGLGAAGAKGVGALPSLLRSIFGVGAREVPSVGSLIVTGAAGGGISGAGEATEGNRLMGAGIGATFGAVAAPVIGKSLEHGLQGAGDILSRLGINPFDEASQRGAIRIGSGGPSRTAYSKAEVLLAKQLKDTPVDRVIQGYVDLDDAINEGVPLFLPEAVRSPKVDRNARFVANYEPSLEFSKNAIETRTRGAQQRATELFDAISPERSPFEGGTQITRAADEIIVGQETARAAQAAPLYEAAIAERGKIPYGQFHELASNDKVITSTIESVKRTANNANLADNSVPLLIKVRSRIGGKIEDLKTRSGTAQEVRDLTDTYNRLNTALQFERDGVTPTLLKTADDAYSAASGQLDELNSTFLKSLQNMGPDKVKNVGQIFGLPPERISSLRDEFVKAGKLDEWNAGIRSHLQNAVESTRGGADNGGQGGANFTLKFFQNTADDKKLRAALGDSYDEVALGLTFENRMFEGKNRYDAGSTTAGNLAEATAFEQDIGVFRSVLNKDFMGAWDKLTAGKMPDEVAQGLAQIYFDPRTGRDALNRIQPLLEAYARNKGGARAAANLSRPGTAQSAGGGASSILPPESQISPGPQLKPQAGPAQPPPLSALREPPRGTSSKQLDLSSIQGASVPAAKQFETPLTRSENAAFEKWANQSSKLQGRDVSRDLEDYDLTGFWKENKDFKWEKGAHLPDTFKKPNHPTFSDESKYSGAQLPDGTTARGGTWEGETFRRSDYSFVDKLFKPEKAAKIPAKVLKEIRSDPIDHAIMLMESGGDPGAKNPESSASGLFQLIKKTAGNLGVKDVFNSEQNYAGFKKLRADTKDTTGDDPQLVYAAHFLGETLLRKVLAGKPITADERKQVETLQGIFLPRFREIYEQVAV